MSVQYISDSEGKTTGVFIPISEWNRLKAKYHDLDQEQVDIPHWQKEEVRQRLKSYINSTEEAMDFDSVMDDLDKNL